MEITLISLDGTELAPGTLGRRERMYMSEMMEKIKFVACVDATKGNIAILFSRAAAHDSVAAKYVRKDADFLGAGTITQDGKVAFDSQSCEEWFGRNAPKEEDRRNALQTAIEKKIRPLIAWVLQDEHQTLEPIE